MNKVIGLPIYFDTVMVMAVLFTFGFWQALGTLSIHYLLSIIQDYIVYKISSFLFLYLIPGVFIIFITWLFSKNTKNYNKCNINFAFLYLLCACFCAAISSAITAGTVNFVIITLFENSLDYWLSQDLTISSSSTTFRLLVSLIIGRIPVTCLDRTITTFIGFGISVFYQKYISKKRYFYEA